MLGTSRKGGPRIRPLHSVAGTGSCGGLKCLRMALIVVVTMATVASAPAAAQICTSYLASLPKDHRLFLYLPASDDSTFPTNTLGNISGVNSQPLGAFTSANIDADLTASTAQLRNLVIEEVTD